MLDALIGYEVEEDRNYKGEREMPYRVIRFHFRAFLFAMSDPWRPLRTHARNALGEDILHNLALHIG